MKLIKKHRTLLLFFFVLIIFIAIIVIIRICYLEEQGNFHIISPGKAYRSAQMDRDEWEHYIHKYNIRSIVNLRGKKENRSWYKEEIEICRKYRIKHYDLLLSATETPSPDKINRLLKIFFTAPRPILIHCKSGADRTGLASAIWKLVIDNSSIPVAKKQLSIRYGHMLIGPTSILDKFFYKFSISFYKKRGYFLNS